MPDTGDHPRRCAIIGLCVGKLPKTVEEKRFYWHNLSLSAGPWRWRKIAFKKQTVSLRGVYVCNVNSIVTKYSDYFVWKDTSERVIRRLDTTSWQIASEFLCIKTPPFLREFGNKKICQNLPEMLSPTRYQCHVFKISRLTPQKKNRVWNRASRGFDWSINLGPNILKSCLLHYSESPTSYQRAFDCGSCTTVGQTNVLWPGTMSINSWIIRLWNWLIQERRFWPVICE